jgi:hypothetical protein
MKTLMIHAAMVCAALVALLAVGPAQATCTTQTSRDLGSDSVQYLGSCTDDNEVLVTTGDLTRYDKCTIMSLAGAVDVFTSLDGTTYATAARSMQDFGAVDTVPVLVTAALREYGIVGKWIRIRILQNGATGASVVINCWK